MSGNGRVFSWTRRYNSVGVVSSATCELGMPDDTGLHRVATPPSASVFLKQNVLGAGVGVTVLRTTALAGGG